MSTEEGKEFVIRHANDFDYSEECMIDISGFDFENQSILGKTIAGGCDLKIKRELIIDHYAKTYTFHLRVKDCGICQKEAYNDNLVIVPAIPEDYEVIFEVERK